MTTRPLQWQQAIRDHPDRPGPVQCHVLDRLSLRLDWSNGTGYGSNARLAVDAQCSPSTVRRAIAWARRTGFLEQTQRGGRRGDKSLANEWQLSQPVTGDRMGSSPNRSQETSQPVTGDRPSRPVSISKDASDRAECPTCHQKYRVQTDGRLRVHGPKGHRCIGSHYPIDLEAWKNRKRQGLPVRLGDLVHIVRQHGGMIRRDEAAELLVLTPFELNLIAKIAFTKGLLDHADEWLLLPGRRGMAKR